MAKKNQLKKQEEFYDVMPFGDDDYSDDMMVGVMGGMLDIKEFENINAQ